jgi:two-component system cell cycle sensor histidine kinase/response regulator CckA
LATSFTGIRKTVLVVDDNAEVLKFVTRTLDAHYNVLTAGGGTDALHQAVAYEPKIHLLLTDVEMPGMSGIDLATRLTLERPDLQVLLMSGFTEKILRLNDEWKFLAKPFTPSQLNACVETLISRPSATFTSTPGKGKSQV